VIEYPDRDLAVKLPLTSVSLGPHSPQQSTSA